MGSAHGGEHGNQVQKTLGCQGNAQQYGQNPDGTDSLIMLHNSPSDKGFPQKFFRKAHFLPGNSGGKMQKNVISLLYGLAADADFFL